MTAPMALGLGGADAAQLLYPGAMRVWDFTRGIYYGERSAHHTLARALDVERGSQAARYDRNGDLRFVGDNIARVSTDPATAVPRGLLVEAQATNQIPWSHDFIDPDWEKDGVVASTGTVAPDDQNLLTRLTEDTSDGVHRLRIWQMVTVGATYTLSAVIRAASAPATTARLVMNGDNIASRVTEIDLDDGSLVSSDGGAQDLGDGLWRVWVSGTATGSGLISCAVQITRDDLSYLGNGTTAIEVGDIQMEDGLRASSIIRSDGALTSRVADRITVRSGQAGIGKRRGTVLIEARLPSTAGSNTVIQIDDDDFSNRVFLTVLAGGEVRLRNRVDGVQQVNLLLGTVTAGVTFRCAFAYADNDYGGSLNGAAATASTNGVSLSDMERFGFGTGAGLNLANVEFDAVATWDKRLSGAELEAMSS